MGVQQRRVLFCIDFDPDLFDLNIVVLGDPGLALGILFTRIYVFVLTLAKC